MPWQLYDSGKTREVIERLKTLNQGQGESDVAQFNAMRDFTIKELELLPPDQDVKIDAQGTSQIVQDGDKKTVKQFSINFHLYTK
jgi:hypothetical protein